MRYNSFSFEVPKEVRSVCRTLLRAGERAYVVGGAIRDMLAGRSSCDFDLATTAPPDKVIGLFKKVIPTGLKHGTVTVLMGEFAFEITTLRGDGVYSDGRRPDRVEFIRDIDADLARRDFTVNAMAWEPEDQVLHDPFGGRQDLDDGVLRAVGSPAERFAEDGLRVLRAARFAATLEYRVERETLAAMGAHAAALEHVSAERKRDEISKLLLADRPSLGLDLMDRTGMFPYISEELGRFVRETQAKDEWKFTLLRVDAIRPVRHLRVAALFANPDYPGESATVSRKWLEQMRFEKRAIELVPHLIRSAGVPVDSEWSGADIRRFMGAVGLDRLEDLFELLRVVRGAGNAPEAALAHLDELCKSVEEQRSAGVPLSIGELAINGKELMEATRMKPGPQIGELLSALLDHVIEHPQDNEPSRLLCLARDMTNENL